MSNPFNQFKNEPQAKTSKGALIRSMSMQVVINCSCGAEEPITVHLIPGVDLKGFCPHCRTAYYVGKIIYENGTLQLGVSMIPPNVVVPQVN